MNWVDRAVGFVAPVAALRRNAARTVLERAAPASSSRQFGGRSQKSFYVNTGNPDDARPKRFVARQTILKLVAENPFARKAMNALLNSVIGWGITGAPAGPKNVRTAWAEWVKICDFNGRLDFYGLQEMIARAMFRDGEVFIVGRIVDAPGIPLRLQLLDKGMLATHKSGTPIERGIEYDGDGRPVAYHFHRRRQGQRWSTGDTVRFAAEEVIHLFHQEFIGQTEGVSIFESVVKRLGDVEEGIEAEVVKANISACMVGFRTRPANDDGTATIGIPAESSAGRPPIEEFVPGMIEQLEEGEEITFSNPPRSGGIGELSRIALLASAAGTGVTYEQMTGDLSRVNFSSFKAGHLEFKRSVGRMQYLTFIPVALDRIWSWFLKTGIDFGQFVNRPVAIKWTPPPFETIDRAGEAKADILEMEAGLESRDNLLAGRGYDPETHFATIAAGRDKQAALNLTFVGDPGSKPAKPAKAA